MEELNQSTGIQPLSINIWHMNFSLKYLSYLINFTSTCYTHIEVNTSLNSDGQQVHQYQ